MSGVKNLRAMFEQKKNEPGGDSPPDRGRSPGPSLGSPTPSSRPLSKVRTNFVAFEKDGRVGLRREPSEDSISVTSRRLSNVTDSSAPAPPQDKNDPFTENMAKNVSAWRTNLANEPIPELPIGDSPVKSSPKKGTETPEITHGPNPDKIVDEEETHTQLTTADPTIQTTAESTPSESNGTSELEKVEEKAQEVKEQVKDTSPVSKPAAATLASPTPAPAKATSKTLRSPSAARAPKSPTKASTQESDKTKEKKPVSTAPKETTTGNAALKPQPSSGKKHIARDRSPAPAAAKPTVKSPTRPAKIPSSILAPTASSGSKTGSAPPPRRSLSREPTNTRTSAAANRPASRTSGVSPAATAAPAKTLKRQASTINRARPSLGLPPKPQAKDHPPTRKEAPVDEGFLARMMRPTQSSAQKAADKVPVTPPRNKVATSAAKKPVAKDGEANAKKAASKLADVVKKDPSVKKTTVAKPEVKKAVAKTATKTTEPSASEVAPVVAQTESAEAAIEAAKTSTDTVVVPQVEHEAEIQEAPEAVSLPEASKSEPEPKLEPAPEGESEKLVSGTTVFEHENPSTTDASTSASAGETNGTLGDAFSPKAEATHSAKEEVEVASLQEDSAPAVTADPKKVEDIEEVVQESSA